MYILLLFPVVKCGDPIHVLPNYLRILHGNKIEYQYLDEIIVGCVGEYEFNGTNTTTCLHTGEWEIRDTLCIGMLCTITFSNDNAMDVYPQTFYKSTFIDLFSRIFKF